MKDDTYYDIDLIIETLKEEKEESDFISGYGIRFIIDHIAGFSKREVDKRRYKKLRSRMTQDIREACDLMGSETGEKENLVNYLDKIFAEMVE